MTQKQIDTLKELGFKELKKDSWIRISSSTIIPLMVIMATEDGIAITALDKRREHPFTLTKLREIVTKLEKL